MADRREIILTAKLNASEVTQELATVEKASGDTTESMKSDFSGVQGQVGMLPGALGGVIGGIKGFVLGLKALRSAWIATGIGALIIALAAVSTYFTKTQKGAEKLEQISATLGAVFDVLTDVISSLGEKIFEAFSNPQKTLKSFADTLKTFVTDKIAAVTKMFGLLGGAVSKVFSGDFSGAMDDAGAAAKVYATEISLAGQIVTKLAEEVPNLVNGLKEVAATATAAAGAANDLAKRSIQLRKDQRALNIEMANSRAEIKEYALLAEDTTAAIDDRIEALEKATDIENGLMAKRLALAQEEVDLQSAKMDLAESTEEDFIKLAELEVALANVKENSLSQQKRLITKLNSLRKEGQAAADAALKAELDALEVRFKALEKLDAATLDAQTKEVDAVAKKYDALLDLAYEYGYDEQELIDAQNAEVAAINKKYSDKELAAETAAADKKKALEKSVRDSKIAMAGAAIGALTALNEAFSKDSEKSARAQFNRNKALGLASATINTYVAIADALAKDATFPGSRFLAAAAAGATGIAQVMKISKTQFDSGTTPSPGGITLPQGGSSPSSAAQLDLGFLGGGSGAEMGRTYVVSQEVSNSQQANQLVNDQAALYR